MYMETDRVSQFFQIQNSALKVFRKKNAYYGDAFAKYGVIEDKLQRSLSITKNGVNLVADEGISTFGG